MSRYSNQKRAKAAGRKLGAKPQTASGADAVSEVKRRKEAMNKAIVELDPSGFADHLIGWLEATAYLRNRADAAGSKDPIAILGGAIPRFSSADFQNAQLRAVADDAVFAFCIVAALNGNAAAADKLEGALVEHFGSAFPGLEALRCCRGGVGTGDPLDDAVGPIVNDMLGEKAFDPRDVWNAGLRLLEKVRKSNFVQEVIVLLAKWHRDRWARIITQQLFNLTRPRSTVPAIEEVLSDNRNDQSFIACLLIAATSAVELELDETYSAHLQALARRN